MEGSGAVYAKLLCKVVSDKMIDKLEEFAKLLKEKRKNVKDKRNYEKNVNFLVCTHNAITG